MSNWISLCRQLFRSISRREVWWKKKIPSWLQYLSASPEILLCLPENIKIDYANELLLYLYRYIQVYILTLQNTQMNIESCFFHILIEGSTYRESGITMQ